MSERIDHAAEAVLCMKYAESPSAGSPEVAAVHMAQAQVHATLALVEQQRIANLITVAGWVEEQGVGEVGALLDELRHGVAGEVWEGLGLS